MIQIDGSMLEGGGSIIRNAVTLSALFRKPIEVKNIRAKRSKPGLRNQHATVVTSIAEICDAEIEGVHVNSNSILFYPGKIKGGEFQFDIKTAGSTILLLQALIPVAAHAPSSVKLLLKGGTDVPMAPPLDYFRFVFLPMMQKLGLDITFCAGRRGHYPKGGGAFSCDVEPVLKMKPIHFKSDEPVSVDCICGKAHAVCLPAHIAERMISSATEEIIKNKYKVGAIEQDCPEPKYDTHIGPGTGITLWGCTNIGTIISGDSLGRRGVPAEDVGKQAARNLLAQLATGRPVDHHLADQLIIWMALSNFPSIVDTTKITLHTLTNIEIIKKFTNAEFHIEGQQGSPGIISCEPNKLPNSS